MGLQRGSHTQLYCQGLHCLYGTNGDAQGQLIITWIALAVKMGCPCTSPSAPYSQCYPSYDEMPAWLKPGTIQQGTTHYPDVESFTPESTVEILQATNELQEKSLEATPDKDDNEVALSVEEEETTIGQTVANNGHDELMEIIALTTHVFYL